MTDDYISRKEAQRRLFLGRCLAGHHQGLHEWNMWCKEWCEVNDE